jgi:AraC family transcriptional regulator
MPRTEAHRLELVTFGSPRFRTVEAGGLLVTDAEFPPGARLCTHVHDRTCVATTLDGRFDSRMDGRSHWSKPSMVLTEPAEEKHENTFGTAGARILVIQPDGRRLECFRPFSGFLDRINHFGDVQVGLLARRLVAEIGAPDAVTPLAVEALGLELLAVAARRFAPDTVEARTPPWLERVRERLHDAFDDRASLTDLAAMAGVHPGHLTRAFRRHYGRSVGAYQRAVRLDWAAGQLTAGAPLAAVSSNAGFADQSHFTRAFKRQFGRTPGQYRAAASLKRTAESG